MAQKTIPPKSADFEQLTDLNLIDVKAVAYLFDCSTNTVWRRFGHLAIKVSPQQTRWRVGDIRKALASLGNPVACSA